METENQNQGGFNQGIKKELPNSTAVLVLGICAIVINCGFIGIILGIIGIVMAKDGRRLYKENPAAYSDYGKLNAGYIMSIIGIILGGLILIYYIFAFVILGSALAAFGTAASAASTTPL